jgi:hypothetical protein
LASLKYSLARVFVWYGVGFFFVERVGWLIDWFFYVYFFVSVDGASSWGENMKF